MGFSYRRIGWLTELVPVDSTPRASVQVRLVLIELLEK